MGDNRDLDVGGRVIGESTKITMSVKTALWIIGGIITLFTTVFTYAYIDVKSSVSECKTQLDANNQALVKQIDNNMATQLEKQRDRDDKFIEDIAKIKGDVQLLLDRNQRVDAPFVIQGAPTISNNTPNSSVPFKKH